MTRDVICVDGEIKTISSDIICYLESLISCISSYNRALRVVQKMGIQDEMIRGKVGNLAILLKNYQAELNTILINFQNYKDRFLTDFESNDVFAFPSSIFTEVELLISMFC